MSICIIHLSDGKVAGVYSNTHEPMEVMVMERDGPRMTEEQQARYRAFQTMVKYGLVMDWQNPPYPVPCAPEFAPGAIPQFAVCVGCDRVVDTFLVHHTRKLLQNPRAFFRLAGRKSDVLRVRILLAEHIAAVGK